MGQKRPRPQASNAPGGVALQEHLLAVLGTLIRVRNVSRAEEMFIAQSAMSNVLGRAQSY